MEETSAQAEDHTPKAVKDKNCPFCGQAFTSSSLGRHLDLYIKERNPKKPDGIHNVDEIRQLRGGVTRRQGLSRRRHASMPAGTTLPASHKRTKASDSGGALSVAMTPAARASSRSADNGTTPLTTDILPAFPTGRLRWKTTGVVNEVMDKSSDRRGRTVCANGDGAADAESDADVDADADADVEERRSEHASATAGVDVGVHSKPKNPHQAPARQIANDEAVRTARAAELALRELLHCLRAADHAIEIGSRPFDFDPLTMNFPALTLRCLKSQPTLFASTQLATPSSWSTAPPGTSQFEALKDFFKEAFRKWTIQCAAATSFQLEEFSYPLPPPTMPPVADRNKAIHRAVRGAEALEEEIIKHLEVAFADWEKLPLQRRTELWVLELARGLATKQNEAEQLRNDEARMKQEIASLRQQLVQLNRLQQPREFASMPPALLPVNERVLFAMQDNAVSQNAPLVGLALEDRHLDLSTVVSSAITRWKKVLMQQHGAPEKDASVADPDSAGSLCVATPPLSGTGLTAPSRGSLGARKNQRRRTRTSPFTATVRTVSVPAVAAHHEIQGTDNNASDAGNVGDVGDVGSEHDGEADDPTDASKAFALPAQAARDVTIQNAEGAETGLDGGAGETADSDKMSDQDADAEMDGDAFSHMHTPISQSIAPTPTRLRAPRNRAAGPKKQPAIPTTVADANPPASLASAGHTIPSMDAVVMDEFSLDNALDMPALDGDIMYTD